jgi:hypothetical protein
LLRMVRHTLKTEAIHQLVDACFRTYPNGLVTNVQKGAVPSQYQSLARYVAKYVVSPPSGCVPPFTRPGTQHVGDRSL